LPWWRLNANGSYVFFVRSGSKPIEFEKGKKWNRRSVARRGALIVDSLVTAVRNGELDEQLAQTKKPGRSTGLAILKYTPTTSRRDRWVENPYFQYFRGEEFFRPGAC
jgi:hypothetical protein